MSKPNNNSGEPRMAQVASWSVLVASFGLSASTWVALAVLAGFTSTLSVFGVTLRLAWLMPIAVDGYVVVALVLWMSNVPAHVARFAKKNTYGAAGIGIAAQSAYHLLFTASTTDQAWRVVLAAIVGALPPAVAGLAVHMRALLHREAGHQAAGPMPARPVPTMPVPTVPATPYPATPAPVQPVPVPSQPMPPATQLPAPEPTPVPASIVDAEPARLVPSPADVAERIVHSRTTNRPHPAPAIDAPAVTFRPRPSRPESSPQLLAAPATDTHVTAPGPAQPMLPLVDPAQLARATEIAAQYRAEHGEPIRPGQLAAKLRVSSERAAQLLDLIDQGANAPVITLPTTAPTATTVNGSRNAAGTR